MSSTGSAAPSAAGLPQSAARLRMETYLISRSVSAPARLTPRPGRGVFVLTCRGNPQRFLLRRRGSHELHPAPAGRHPGSGAAPDLSGRGQRLWV